MEGTEPKQVYVVKLDLVSERTIKDIIIIKEVTEVDFVPTSVEDCPEGEHLRFKDNVRGWKTEVREKLCQMCRDACHLFLQKQKIALCSSIPFG
jgi:hypothetical protein